MPKYTGKIFCPPVNEWFLIPQHDTYICLYSVSLLEDCGWVFHTTRGPICSLKYYILEDILHTIF